MIVFFLPSIAFSQQILITEVMYDLDGTDSPNEFVEIFNPSETDSLNMDGSFGIVPAQMRLLIVALGSKFHPYLTD